MLGARIAEILAISGPAEKSVATRALFADLSPNQDLGELPPIPDRPGRLEKPELIPPAQVPKRKITRGVQGRFALLHALAHIELNAVNLALDIAVRFGTEFGPNFVADWLSVADDEAKHFLLLQARLHALGGDYGDLPAHDGLWMSAIATKDAPSPVWLLFPWCWRRAVWM